LGAKNYLPSVRPVLKAGRPTVQRCAAPYLRRIGACSQA